MRAFAHWYVVVEILGALVLPLAWRLFRHLPDRGYCFGKILAILLVGYAFWTGTAYGLLRNELGGAVLAVLIVTVASGVAGWRMLRGTQAGRRPLVEGMRRLTPVILNTEALFLLAFGGWAVVRSWGPEANHTEQPMDLLLLSAIWTSSSFPPQDPWLAGYAISYYYFGYWLLATIARLAGQPPEIAYNPGQACWFGLLLTACFGVGFNLAALARRTSAEAGRRGAPMLGGLLAAVSVALIGNLQGLLDAVRIGWDWLRNPNRAVQLTGETTTWWWWRSSRVIRIAILWVAPSRSSTSFRSSVTSSATTTRTCWRCHSSSSSSPSACRCIWRVSPSSQWGQGPSGVPDRPEPLLPRWSIGAGHHRHRRGWACLSQSLGSRGRVDPRGPLGSAGGTPSAGCLRALAVQSGRSYRWSRGDVSSPSAAFKENAMETVAQGARFGGGRAAARNRR